MVFFYRSIAAPAFLLLGASLNDIFRQTVSSPVDADGLQAWQARRPGDAAFALLDSIHSDQDDIHQSIHAPSSAFVDMLLESLVFPLVPLAQHQDAQSVEEHPSQTEREAILESILDGLLAPALRMLQDRQTDRSAPSEKHSRGTPYPLQRANYDGQLYHSSLSFSSDIATSSLRGRGLQSRSPIRDPNIARSLVTEFIGVLREVSGAMVDMDTASNLVPKLPESFSIQLSNMIISFGDAALMLISDAASTHRHGEQTAERVHQPGAKPTEDLKLNRTKNDTKERDIKTKDERQLILRNYGAEASPGVPLLVEKDNLEYVFNSWTASSESIDSSSVAESDLIDGMEARSAVISAAREIGAWSGADNEQLESVQQFVDEFLVPSGTAGEVAAMIDRAQEEMRMQGYVSPGPSDLDEQKMKAILAFAMELKELVGSKVECVAMAKAFFKFVLVPLGLAVPVADLLLDQKSKLLLAFATKALLLGAPGLKVPGDDGLKKLLLLGLVAPKALALLKPSTGFGNMDFKGLNDETLKKLLLLAVVAPKALELVKPSFGFGGLDLKGLGDDGLKKLLLLALIAPKGLDLLKKGSGGDLLPLVSLIPLLSGAKADKLVPLVLLAVVASGAPELAGLLKAALEKAFSLKEYGVEEVSDVSSDGEADHLEYVFNSWTASS
ncbi:hypothetical protein CSUI_010076, partial [Cystoisospora suis]